MPFKVTVVVPVYNVNQYLRRALDSLLKQTYKNYEIVLINDGSTDDSGTICDRYAQEYSNIRVFHKENGGVSSARNLGIERANGMYITFVDPDDWIKDTHLETLVKLLEEGEADLAITSYYIADENGCRKGNSHTEMMVLDQNKAIELLLYPHGFQGYSWNKLYKMKGIKEHSLRFDTELSMMEDILFNFEYILKCQVIIYDPVPTYYYYHHIGGMTNTFSPITDSKLKGFQMYEKLKGMTDDTSAKYSELINANAFHFSCDLIYSYFRQKTKDKELYKKLNYHLRINYKYFMKSTQISKKSKLRGTIAFFSPRMYFLTHETYGGLKRKILKR